MRPMLQSRDVPARTLMFWRIFAGTLLIGGIFFYWSR
jgi:hypothetical protein